MKVFLFLISLCIALPASGCGDNMHNSKPGNLFWDVESAISYGFYELAEMDQISEQDLEGQKFIKIADPRLSHLFSKASFQNSSVLWKGGKLVVINLKSGDRVRIKASNYGNFFLIAGQKGYYFFEDTEDQKLWDYLFFGEGLKKYLKES